MPPDDEKVKICYLNHDGKRACAEISKPVIYTTPGCPFCAMSRGHLRGRGVPFKEVQVTDRKRLTELVAASGQTGAPVIKIGKRIIVGYYPDKIDAALGIRRRRK